MRGNNGMWITTEATPTTETVEAAHVPVPDRIFRSCIATSDLRRHQEPSRQATTGTTSTARHPLRPGKARGTMGDMDSINSSTGNNRMTGDTRRRDMVRYEVEM